METVRTPAEVRALVLVAKKREARVGFVPTMGALHEGHASLVGMARERTDFVVASIFVNPKQFGPTEDLGRYPRTLDADLSMLRDLGCDLAFTPADRDLYSRDDRTRIAIRDLADGLCGRFRPGHFDGVLLVVAKLFNIVLPDEAFFGQKDAQQAVVIQRMAADLDMPVRIVLGRTVREADGLALSSRNRYLDADRRRRAAGMWRSLDRARALVVGGERDADRLRRLVREGMEEAGFAVEYADVVDGASLRPIGKVEGVVLIAAAGRLGETRLIDNVALRVEGERVEETLLEFPEWSRYHGG
ncbi:MAG: pantoate--beta-alanine ligase [Candidatus Krumholzibacteriota bacterium]|nr:pantoate--beta-alanine ligase [Candidatus Krumholzibacteriota bacterium]